MEKIIFLLVAIVISILWKALTKSAANKETHGPGGLPQSETAPDAVPVPEDWGKMFAPKDIFQPITVEPSTVKQPQKPKKSARQMPESKQFDSSRFGTLGNQQANAEGEGGTLQSASSHSLREEPSTPETEFTIHSAEEARRAIIWGEILQRKY